MTVALLAVHGMGDTPPNFADEFKAAIRKRLGAKWQNVHFESVYYQPVLQGSQRQVFDAMRKHIDWMRLREFMLYGFSDAASLEFKKDEVDSPYFRAQEVVLNVLDRVHQSVGDVPVVIIAQSLGCQVLSSYLWDAERAPNAFAGVFKGNYDGIDPASPQAQFRRLRSLQALYTTGNNMPIFAAGHQNIRSFSKPHPNFRWFNFFDEDDVLGWPMQPLSADHKAQVTDMSINAGNLGLGAIFKSWNPLSHELYWSDKAVLSHVASTIRALM